MWQETKGKLWQVLELTINKHELEDADSLIWKMDRKHFPRKTTGHFLM